MDNTTTDEKEKDSFCQQPPHRPLEDKWTNRHSSNYPPKLKGQVMTPFSSSPYHLYLIYSLTVLCLLLSTYSFSHIFKLQQEVSVQLSSDLLISSLLINASRITFRSFSMLLPNYEQICLDVVRMGKTLRHWKILLKA